jgi:hypothetical protein
MKRGINGGKVMVLREHSPSGMLMETSAMTVGKIQKGRSIPAITLMQ